jgi:glycine/D-amino acid oxidase-like deaminating enzyme
MKLASYWHDTAPRFNGAVQGPPNGRADVVVVGGGFTGLTAALTLAKKGAQVVLLEAELVGSAASGRNGGHVNNGFAQDYGAMCARLGTERANMLYRSFDAGVDTVERIIREEGIDCDFGRTGKLKLAAKPAHYDKLARSQELLAREVDPDTHMVSKAALSEELGSDAYFGGLVFGKSAGMHMGKFVQGLASAATHRGVRIYENTPLTAMRRTANGHEVQTPGASVQARQVLLATGTSAVGPLAWSGDASFRWAPISSSRSSCRRTWSIESCRGAAMQRTPAISSTSSASRRTTGCFSAAARGSPLPARHRTRRAGRSCAAIWSPPSPISRMCASTTAGAAWST